jgi:hypothetical protein
VTDSRGGAKVNKSRFLVKHKLNVVHESKDKAPELGVNVTVLIGHYLGPSLLVDDVSQNLQRSLSGTAKRNRLHCVFRILSL